MKKLWIIPCSVMFMFTCVDAMSWVRSATSYISGGAEAVYKYGASLVAGSATAVSDGFEAAKTTTMQAVQAGVNAASAAQKIGTTAYATCTNLVADMQKNIDQLMKQLERLKGATGFKNKAQEITPVMAAFKVMIADLFKPLFAFEQMANYATVLGVGNKEIVEQYRQLTILYQTYIGALLEFLSTSLPGMFEYISQLQDIAPGVKPAAVK